MYLLIMKTKIKQKIKAKKTTISNSPYDNVGILIPITTNVRNIKLIRVVNNKMEIAENGNSTFTIKFDFLLPNNSDNLNRLK